MAFQKIECLLILLDFFEYEDDDERAFSQSLSVDLVQATLHTKHNIDGGFKNRC